MQILDDLYGETKRLFIAGSPFAKDDPRIKKFLPMLAKMGEKAPIMQRLAAHYTALITGGEPEALSEAGTFLYAVMATQGVTDISGQPTEPTPTMHHRLPKTKTPYSRLKPIIDALTMSKQGRYEVIQTAHNDKLLDDFRLYSPMVAALNDKYTDLADFLYATVMPGIGAPLIPYLLVQYNPQGKRGDAMRLALLHKLGYAEVERLAFEAITSDPVIAVEAIRIISENPANEDYLIKLSGDKKAAFREAALIGLVGMDSPRGKDMMMQTLASAKYKSAVPAAKLCGDKAYTGKMLNLLQPLYDGLFVKGLADKDFKAQNQKFSELFGALENKTDPAVYAFFAAILKSADYAKLLRSNKIYAYQTEDVRHLICDYLEKVPACDAVKVFEDAGSPEAAKHTEGVAAGYYRAATAVYTPERLYEVFSGYYALGLIGFNALLNIYDDDQTASEKLRTVMDPRWKKLFIQRKDMAAISVLLCNDDELASEMKSAILKALKEAADQKTADRTLGQAVGRLVETTERKKNLLFKDELEKAAALSYEIFDKLDNSKASYFYAGLTEANFTKLFYPEYAAPFKALAKRKTHYIFRHIESLLQEAEKTHGEQA